MLLMMKDIVRANATYYGCTVKGLFSMTTAVSTSLTSS